MEEILEVLVEIEELGIKGIVSDSNKSVGKTAKTKRSTFDAALEALQLIHLYSRGILDKEFKWRKGAGAIRELPVNSKNLDMIYSGIGVYLNPKGKWIANHVNGLVNRSEKRINLDDPSYLFTTEQDEFKETQEDLDNGLHEEEFAFSDDEEEDKDEEEEEEEQDEEEEDEGEIKEEEEEKDDDDAEEFDAVELDPEDHDSELDDEFFHSAEMDKFANKLEMDEELQNDLKEEREKRKRESKLSKADELYESQSEDEESYLGEDDTNVDLELFEQVADDDNDGDAGIMYEDFFGSKKNIKPLKPTPAQIRKERMMEKIKELENENLGEKEWQLTGETTAKKRPQNSLLEIGDLDVDVAAPQAPIMTAKMTQTLEEIIIRRIRDADFDDVKRRVAPDQDADYRPALELSVTKSTEGLGDIYAKEYEKKVLGNASASEIALSKTHLELHEMFSDLVRKLDSLSNFHFTPKAPKTASSKEAGDVSVAKKNDEVLPAIQMEEVIPIAVSSSALKTPEEILSRKEGLGKSSDELTAQERKRMRQNRKEEKRHEKKVENENKLVVSKLSSGMKRGAIARYEESSQTKKSKPNDDDSKKWTSSGQFFKQLQENEKGEALSSSTKERVNKNAPSLSFIKKNNSLRL